MNDAREKTGPELLAEIEALKKRLASLETTQDEDSQTGTTPNESEEMYRNLIEHANDGIVILQDGNVKFLNRRMSEMLGYGNAGIIDKPFTDYVKPEEAGRLLERFARRMAGDPAPSRYETTLINSAGKFLDVEINAGHITYNGRPADLVIIRDMTEHKEAEKALRKSEEKYRLLVENANDVILIAQDGVIRFFNHQTSELTGYSDDELEGKPFIELIHPDERGFIENRHKRRLKGDELPSTYSFRVLHKNGRTMLGQINTVKIDWQGRPATLNFIRDITEQKKIDARLRMAQKMEAVGTLAGGIAHDFNNLLMAIQGGISLMLLETDKGLPNYDILKGIERQIQSGSKLTRQLLGYARRGKYEVKPLDINKIIDETAETFGRAKREIKVHKRLDRDLYPVNADLPQIEQVLLNLCLNAADAMPEGGKLFIDTANVSHLDLSAKQYSAKKGNYAMIRVTDSGTGIDKGTIDRIFEPFFTTKEMGRGTGLGLASVYGIVKGHGGYIDVESEVGKGTTFFIYLPASKKRAEIAAGLENDIVTGEGTILLVDDEPMLLDVGARMLERIGYKVFKAKSGIEALAIFEKIKDDIDLIMLDMVMPDSAAEKTFEGIKAVRKDIKVLISSGYSEFGEAEEIMSKGCDGFIQKPFDIAGLSKKINEILTQKA